MANIIAPRRNESLTERGTGTIRFMEYLEKSTSQVNDSTGQVEKNRLDILILDALIVIIEAQIIVINQDIIDINQDIIDIKLRLDALENPVLVDALVSLNGNTTETVITTIDTPVLVAGTWAAERQELFTADTAGRITYIGTEDDVITINSTITITSASGIDQNIHCYVALNGAFIPNSGMPNKVGTTDPRNTSLLWQLTMSENDYLEIFIENNTDTINLIASDAIFRVTGP